MSELASRNRLFAALSYQGFGIHHQVRLQKKTKTQEMTQSYKLRRRRRTELEFRLLPEPGQHSNTWNTVCVLYPPTLESRADGRRGAARAWSGQLDWRGEAGLGSWVEPGSSAVTKMTWAVAPRGVCVCVCVP